MQVFHLSHIDLDGYGCQFISHHFFENITYYNANYGREVSARLHEIADALQAQANQHKQFLVLVTDLNLSLGEAEFLQKQSDGLRSQGAEVQLLLLDHHITGKEAAETYHWYHLDVDRSASKITFETLKAQYPPLQDLTSLESMVEMINSIDIWKEGEFGFELGKVCMRMIAGSSELNRFMFDTEHRNYKFALLEQAQDYIAKENGAVIFDNDLFRLKKIALGGNPDQEIMDNIASNAQVALLSQKKEECSVYCEGKRGFLSYSMGGISVLANLFLCQNSEFDFYMDVNPRGNVSLRSNGKCDVSNLSKQYFNGGGHKNASGGRIEGFKESFSYYDIKEQVEKALNKTTETDYGFFGNRFQF
ncbi:DHH family phosphoesterase [Helicobacter mehlei]|uniref:3',5'-cyclic-nucleotide phosphodiesterase n=1 Tax=Helicobacter mehlei TaxID=2316080 RepID=A0A553UX33_9HELI|nr:DHHA1 domain-containing protein [Helicobacter mehlei]TSA84581.1 3',5'-cyclic-nucleotide phosphodiesterase [Helicobacter mehlei]